MYGKLFKAKGLTLLLMLLLFSLEFNPAVVHAVPAETSWSLSEKDRETYANRLQMAANYLRANFNAALKLVCESPDSPELARTYWLVSDNLLASYALQPYHPEVAREIGFQLRYVWGYSENALHGVLFNHRLAPRPVYGVEAVVVKEGPDNDGDGAPDYIVKTEKLTDRALNIYDYADRLCYQALFEVFHGRLSQASNYLNQAVKLWDGRGLADRVYRQHGYYETYKLAVLYYTAKVLGRLESLSFREKLLTIIFRLQADNGGFYTRYIWGNEGPKPLPGATTNSETTSLVIIALTYNPRMDPPPEQGYPANFVIMLPIAVIASFLLFLIILRKAARKHYASLTARLRFTPGVGFEPTWTPEGPPDLESGALATPPPRLRWG